MCDFKALPGLSRFLLESHLDAFSVEQLRLSRQMDLPLLKRLQHLDDDMLIQITKTSMVEFLQYLGENKALEQIEISLDRWVRDQLEVIGKFELQAEDISMVNHVRAVAFRNFVPQYTQDPKQILELIDELDRYFTASTTASMNTYIMLLKEQIERHERELLEAQRIAHIGSFEWDLEEKKAHNSPELRQIFELEDERGGFENFLEYVHADDRARLQESLSDAVNAGRFECEYRYCRNGKMKYIWSRGITISEGNRLKLVGTVQDITERKIAEQELVEKTHALERSNESLQQFAYVASHDLKEPLRKIATFTNMVLTQEEDLSPDSRRGLEKAHLSAMRMRQMIDGIMAYSTLTQWEERVDYQMGDLVREAVEILEQSIEDKKAVIHYGSLPKVHVVPSQFRQLFQNLISNSLKFSHPAVPPEITITHKWLTRDDFRASQLIHADRYLEVSVKDNGIGFNVEFVNKIFDLYSRLHSKSEYEGSGLGLAIAKRIIDNHNGSIRATSEEGKGACFSFVIPQ
jgi:PAS domain S-box-containing protein